MKHNKQAWTIAVLFLASLGFAQINNGGGGGGSGTVGNCTAAGNAYYSASGTTTTCDTNLTDNGAGAITSAQGTITTSAPVFSHTVTWNAGGVAFTNWLSNITCTAAATASIAAGFGTAGTQWQFKYNAANCGTPQLLSPSGTGANPAYSFSSNNNEGFFLISNFPTINATTGNGVGFQVNSTNVFTVQGGGLFGAAGQGNNLLVGTTAPTVSSGFGTSPSIANNNGTLAFTVNVGTGGTATSGVIGLPTAAHGWDVDCKDITTTSATVFITKQTATSTTTATVGNFNTSGAAAAWVASDILSCKATAY